MREGHVKTTTIGVAEVAGYGLGSIYDYFPNEEWPVATLVERHAETMVAVVESRRLGRCAYIFSSGPFVLTTV